MTIFDSIGGSEAVAAVVDDFYARLVDDSRLAPYFADVDMKGLKSHQRAFIAAALGGPRLYQGRDMAAAHADLAITGEDFDAVVGHLVETLAGLGVAAETIEEIGAVLAPLREDIVAAPAEQPTN